jgi:putative glycerol-1-phosphate prenyltransferase
MAVMKHILLAKEQSRKLLVWLMDPEKPFSVEILQSYISLPDMIFVGGSTGSKVDAYIANLRQFTDKPIVLFPGNITQFSPNADALLFLSLLNAKTADMLITPHIEVARKVKESGIESIPMGYILLDGGRKSSVEIVSHATPIPQTEVDRVVATALAGQLLGKQLIYLEAGSGARLPISTDVIRAVSEQVELPLIVGGGIRAPEAMLQAFDAGADVVVIGNHFEQYPDEIGDFVRIKSEKYGE